MPPQAEKRKASRPSSGFLKEHETPSDHILESAFNHSNQKVFSRLQKPQGWGTQDSSPPRIQIPPQAAQTRRLTLNIRALNFGCRTLHCFREGCGFSLPVMLEIKP